MKSNPVPVEDFVQKLKGYDSVYRIRVGGFRLVYSVEWSEKTISIHYVASRKKAYK